MRCFVAVDYEGDTSKLKQFQREIAGLADATLAGQFHVTLKFIGEVSGQELPVIENAIARVAGQFEPFAADITGIDAFPNARAARVVWAGTPALFNLQKAMQDALPPADKDIAPHLTLARIRSAGDGLAAFVRSHERTPIGSLPVDEIRLKQSTLRRSGPVYETIGAWKLGGSHA